MSDYYGLSWQPISAPIEVPVGTLVRYRYSRNPWSYAYTTDRGEHGPGLTVRAGSDAHLFIAAWAHEFQAAQIVYKGDDEW